MVKRNYDDLIITVGAIIIGWGLYNYITKQTAFAYAAAPCASTCAPFVSSPGTYATCCKQHAATAAAPKAPVRPAGFRTATVKPAVVKSKAPKPQSAFKLIDDNFDTLKPGLQQLQNLAGNDPTNQPTAPIQNGGGDCGTAKMECHNYGDRHEDKVDQTGASFEYGGTFLIPKATRHLTLEFGGLPHSGGNDRSGYKVEFNDGKPGVMLWKQVDTDYRPIKSAISGNTNYTAKIGSKINVVIRKQDIGSSSNPTGVEINAWADGESVGRWRDTISSPLAGLPPYTGFVKGYRAGFRHDCLKGCCVKSCCTEGEPGPSVICGPLRYTPLQNLPN